MAATLAVLKKKMHINISYCMYYDTIYGAPISNNGVEMKRIQYYCILALLTPANQRTLSVSLTLVQLAHLALTSSK